MIVRNEVARHIHLALNEMKSKANFKCMLFLFIVISTLKSYAHPAGNMITVGQDVLWSYIDPIDDLGHHACIMIWSMGAASKVFLKSEFQASDYMLYNKGEDIYIIERRHIHATQKFKIRILKTKIGEEPKEIWSWFEDKWRIGEGGFFMTSDHQIVFGRFPGIYSLNKNEILVTYFDVDASLYRIRAVANKQILLLGDHTCRLVSQSGKIIREWNNIINDKVENAALNRNQIFDADYKNGELLLAYWGKRSFEIIDNHGKHKTIVQLDEPQVPHWVAYYNNDKLLFSSTMLFNGETPRPNLLLYTSAQEKITIWEK